MTKMERAIEFIEGNYGNIDAAKRIIVDLIDTTKQLEAEILAMQALVPHPGDGTCDVCGCAPASPATLCDDCRG